MFLVLYDTVDKQVITWGNDSKRLFEHTQKDSKLSSQNPKSMSSRSKL